MSFDLFGPLSDWVYPPTFVKLDHLFEDGDDQTFAIDPSLENKMMQLDEPGAMRASPESLNTYRLVSAAEEGNLDKVRDLAGRVTDVNARDYRCDHLNALEAAASKGHHLVVMALFEECGAKVTIQDARRCVTVLDLAVDSGSSQTEQELLAHVTPGIGGELGSISGVK